MKPEPRISNLVLFTGLAALLLALVALWYGWGRSGNRTGQSAAGPDPQSPEVAVSNSTAGPATPPSTEPVAVLSGELPPVIPLALSNLLVEAENSVWHKDSLMVLQPRGAQTFGGVEFRVDGMIQLQSAGSIGSKQNFRRKVVVPLTVTNLAESGAQVVQLGSNVGCLYLLGATRYSGDTQPGVSFAELIWRYADGDSRRTPISYAVHLRDWRRMRYEEPARLPGPGTKVVWRAADRTGSDRSLRLYRLTLANPLPQKAVRELEFASTSVNPSLFFTALTLDPLKAGERPDDAADLEEVDPPPGRILDVLVTDTGDQPLPGIRVRAVFDQKNPEGKSSRINKSLSADAKGMVQFKFPDANLDSLELYAWPDEGNYSSRSVTWDTKAGDTIPASYTIKLPAGIVIGGSVVDQTGNPIAAAKLEAHRFWTGGDSMVRKGDEPDFYQKTTTTDDQGHWQMTGLTPELLDHISVQASHPDFIGASFNVGDNAATEQKLRGGTHRLALKGGAEVRVLVTDDGDTPISGATVWAGSRYTASRQEKKTGADGRANFRNISEGNVQFSVTAKGRKPDVKTTAVKSNLTEVVFKLARGNLVRGIVQNEAGEPLPGARMSLESSSGGVTEAHEFETTTGADGRFEWDGAPDEPQGFYFYKSGYEQKRRQKLYPDRENVVTLRKSRQVQGWVLDADTEKPVAKFRIGVGRSTGVDNFYADYPGMKTFADANGTFTLELTEEENVAVKAEADDYAAKVEKLPEAQNGVVQVVLRLKPSASLRGVVLNAEGTPVAGATVAFSAGQRGSPGVSLRNGRLEKYSQGQVQVADANGTFALTSPPESGLVVAAAPVGFGMATIQQVRDSGRIVLQQYGRIEGTFTVGGQPVADHEFLLSMRDAGIDLDWNAYRVKTDEGGHFAIGKAPPGEGEIVRLIKTSPNSWQHSHNTSVTVQPGQTTQVTLGDSGAVLQGRVRFETPPPDAETLVIGGMLNSVMPPMTRTFATAEESQAYYESPEWRARMKDIKHFGVSVGPDGSLTLDSVPPGTYTLNLSATKPSEQPWNSKPVASGTATVTVPEGVNPRSPIRLDEIILRPVAKPGGP